MTQLFFFSHSRRAFFFFSFSKQSLVCCYVPLRVNYDPWMVELVFTPTSAYRSSPGGAQIPENGYYTRFPWALIILRTASVQSSCTVQPGEHACSGHTGRGVRPPMCESGSTASSGMLQNLSTKPQFPRL